MDPNATLHELRQLMSDAEYAGLGDYATSRVTELFQALDSWITKGGFLPSDWSRS